MNRQTQNQRLLEGEKNPPSTKVSVEDDMRSTQRVNHGSVAKVLILEQLGARWFSRQRVCRITPHRASGMPYFALEDGLRMQNRAIQRGRLDLFYSLNASITSGWAGVALASQGPRSSLCA